MCVKGADKDGTDNGSKGNRGQNRPKNLSLAPNVLKDRGLTTAQFKQEHVL